MSGWFAGDGGDIRPSALDRLDARTRVVAALAVVLVAVASRDPLVLAGLLIGVVVAAGTLRVAPGEIVHRLVHVEGFLIVLVLLLPFTVPGETVFAVGPFAASRPGLDRALLVVLRVNVAALSVLTLIAGLEPVRLGHALGRLGLPLSLVHLFLFAVRWVGLLRTEAGRLADAMRVRGFRAGPTRHGLRSLGHFAGQMLVRAFERAERVDEAMRCRGFSGRFALVTIERFGAADALFAGSLGLALAVTLALEHLR